MSVLVCDLGGTNTRLGLASEDGLDVGSIRRFSNEDYTDFDTVLGNYLAEIAAGAVETAVVAVAAPVTQDVVELTNREWRIAKKPIAAIAGARRVHFINDYNALAAALIASDTLETVPVLTGKPDPLGPRLVLGAGTGFNAACLLPGDGAAGERILTAEVGHASFPAHGALATELRDHVARQHGRCSLDRILSGPGLAVLYRLICQKAGASARLEEPASITASGLAGTDDEAIAACALFVEMLARTAGDLALTYLATGGVHLTGGVVRALLPFIALPERAFVDAFLDKGRMSAFMGNFPVAVLSDDHVALDGCLAWLERLDSGQAEQGRTGAIV